jgi:hypothetical protein
MKHCENNLKGGLKLETKHNRHYQVVEVYKKIIKNRNKLGKDSLSLRKRLLAILVKHGEDKSAYSV